MSGEARENSAVRYLRNAARLINSSDVPTAEGIEVTEDFRFVDRRTGGVNFGAMSGPDYLQGIISAWHTGAGRPYWSVPRVVDTRGDRSALVVLALEYENGTRQEMLHVEHVDDSLRTRCAAQFDLEDVGAAMAELDRVVGQGD